MKTIIISFIAFVFGIVSTDIYHDIQKQEKRQERQVAEACNALSDADGTPWDECMRSAGYVIKF